MRVSALFHSSSVNEKSRVSALVQKSVRTIDSKGKGIIPRLSMGVQAYLPLHNFTISCLVLFPITYPGLVGFTKDGAGVAVVLKLQQVVKGILQEEGAVL